MKTNQIMIRKMGDFEVIQRTKDSMFNATTLLKQWNDYSGQQKQIVHYFENLSTREFINEIIKREFPDNGIPFSAENQVFIKQKGGKDKGSTWMHPLLFIDFALWLNSSFKYDVLKFVYDEMIKYRHNAGDEYRNLGSAVQKIVSNDFIQTAMQKIGEALNWIVFNKHEHGIRNKFGDETKQRELYMLEKKIADLINEGFITDYKQIINYLRKLYHEKHVPQIMKFKIKN